MSSKEWLSLDDQIALLKARGLRISDEAYCRDALEHVGYYHLSGYARFFQIKPSHGENDYIPGTSFESIAQLHYLDARVRQLCITHLATVELALRTGFAYRFGELVRPYVALQQESTYFSTGANTPVHDLILDNLSIAPSKCSYPVTAAWMETTQICQCGLQSKPSPSEHCRKQSNSARFEKWPLHSQTICGSDTRASHRRSDHSLH